MNSAIILLEHKVREKHLVKIILSYKNEIDKIYNKQKTQSKLHKKMNKLLKKYNYSWNMISKNGDLSNDFLIMYKKRINWNILLYENKIYLNEDVINEVWDYIKYNKRLYMNYILSFELINKRKDDILWEYIIYQHNIKNEYIINNYTFLRNYLIMNFIDIDDIIEFKEYLNY
jgi:hypothetical protein